MSRLISNWNRRHFLSAAGIAGALSSLRPSSLYAAHLASRHGEIYRQLGVRPLINAAGTYTTLTGSIITPQCREAMLAASECFVRLIDLQQAVGARIAKLLDVEAALVSCGAASSILLATAACITRGDSDKVRRLPDVSGMKNEVIMVKQHRMGFDHAARAAGAKIVEVDTVAELKSAINPNTAMLFYVHIFEPKGKISRAEFVAAGKQTGVPVFNDAAAELPPAENLTAIVKEGFDLVGFSGGKGLRGPQAAGLLVGRKELIDAAHKNNNPHSDTIGRTMKVGKEEIMGMLAAIETYVARDHDADQRTWRGFMERVAKDLKGVPTVETEVYIPGPGGHPVPYLRVAWDEAKIPLSYQECANQLREGEPSIEVNAQNGDAVRLASYNLFPGEDRIVGWRLREVLMDAMKKS